MHFVHRHVQDTMIIMEEGDLPHPRCLCCDILLSQAALNIQHPNTAHCDKGEERERCRLAAKEAISGTERCFGGYGCLITTVTSFKCIGYILTDSDDDWSVVVENLRRRGRNGRGFQVSWEVRR